MKKILLLLMVSFIMIQDTNAQNELKGNFRRFSVDISGGIPIVYADIKNKFVGYDFSARLNWNLTSAVSLGTEFAIGNVKGENQTGEHFSNKYLKALVGGEVYLFDLFKFNQLSKWFQPYAGFNFGGIKSDIEKSQSDNHFNDWVWAQQINAGLKFKLTNMMDLNLSGNFMYTGSDLLDNYSPNTNNNKLRDALSTFRLGLTFHIGKKENPSIIWKGGENFVKSNKVKNDSAKMYTQNKLIELENKLVGLERSNNMLNTKLGTAEKEVETLEVEVEKLNSKIDDMKINKMEHSSYSNSSAMRSMETTVYFNTGSDEISMSERSKLSNITSYLSTNPNAIIVVSGYTDKRGDEQSNLRLSLRRANKVKNHLLNLGVDGSLIETYGFGENHLLPDSDRGNRRVVLTVR